MKNYFYLFAALLLMVMIGCEKTVNVAKEEEAIKNVIQKQNDAINNLSVESEASVWANEPFIIRLEGNNLMTIGWDSIHVMYKKGFDRMSKLINRTKFSVTRNYHKMHILKNAAWAVYDQSNEYAVANKKQTYVSREIRIFEKINKQWRIVLQYTISIPDPTSAEDDLNTSGDRLLSLKKINEAIEIFKLNVKLYPESYIVYNSLGNAYMANGDKKLAIENYEKSLKLNPQSTIAVEMLKKLRGE